MTLADLLNGMALPPVVACIYALCPGSTRHLTFLATWVAGSTAGTVDALLSHEWMWAAGGAISLTTAIFFWFSHRHRDRATKLLGEKARAAREALVAVMRKLAQPNPALRPLPNGGQA